MRSVHQILLAALLVGTAAACGSNNSNVRPNDPGDAGMVDATDNLGGGTCAMPIDLNARGTVSGMDTVFHGTTSGRPNELHSYGCTAMDSSEVVFQYRVPDDFAAVRVTTAGSGFNTALYARRECTQQPPAAMEYDVTCNDDSHDGAPQSTIYLTNFDDGREFFLVVDGVADPNNPEAPPSDGEFTLTVTPVPVGTMGNPCRLAVDGSTAPRCDAGLQCSEGGGPDGTSLCVPPVALGATCDPRGFTNACTNGANCVADPSPPAGMEVTPACRMPGTAAGAPCRMTEPRCDGALRCGSGEYPHCVRVLASGDECDPSGYNNVCPMGTQCRVMGDAGAAHCAR